MTQLLCSIGISGSGKSTYFSKYSKESIICPDEIRKEFGDVSSQKNNAIVWKLAKERVITRLTNDLDTIFDSTCTNSKLRGQFLQDIPNNVEKIAIVFPLPDLDIAYDRVTKDIDNGVDRSNVPKAVIERQIIQFKNDYDKILNEFDEVLYVNDDLKGYTTKGSDI